MPCWPNRKKKVGSPTSSVSIITEIGSTGSGSGSRKSMGGQEMSARSSLLSVSSTDPTALDKMLQEVFSYLSVNELLSARGVCKRWNTAACHILRRKIEGAVILQRGLSYYTRVMGRSLSIPIGRLFLKIDDMNDPSVQSFFRTVGESVIFLVLNLEGANLAKFLGEAVHLRNLNQLSLNLFQEEVEDPISYRRDRATSVKIFIDDYDSPVHEDVKLEELESFVLSCEPEWKSNEALLLEKLLEMAPNLKNLNLNKWPFMLKPKVFENCGFERLKFLSLKSISDENLVILGEKKLPVLKTVEFELARDVSQEGLTKFLENVGQSLEYIEVKSEANPQIGFKLPVMMKGLATIRLAAWVGPVFLDSVIDKAPNLEKLQLSHVNPANILLKEGTKPTGKLDYLAINFGSGNHSMKTIFKTLKGLVLVFPGLKVFMMKKVSDKTLELVCDGWPGLQALRITTSFSLTDGGITGLPASSLQKIPKTEWRLGCGCCVPFNIVNGKADCGGFREAPHIGKLRNLKDLRIEAEPGTSWTLTNLSLHLGLSELRQLRSLKLTSHELGPHWCLRCIADNFPHLTSLTVMDRAISHDRYDEQELQYLLRKLPNLNLNFAEADNWYSNNGKRGS